MRLELGKSGYDRVRGYSTPVERKIPLVENYAVLLDKTGSTWEAISFYDALNKLQSYGGDKVFLIKGLYQVFWFLTSVGGVCIPKKDNKPIKGLKSLLYEFSYYDYEKQNYIFELARHIYKRSFPNN